MMLEVFGAREANAPLAGRRMLSASLAWVGIVRQARPRSAVTVSPTAPGLAPLTGFSRSGGRSRSSLRSVCPPNRRYVHLDCRGLEAVVAYVANGGPAPFTRPLALSGAGGHFMIG